MTDVTMIIAGIPLAAVIYRLGRRHGRADGFNMGVLCAFREVATSRLEMTDRDAAELLNQTEGLD